MVCARGIECIPEGERGLYFLCDGGEYNGNQCKHVRMCFRSGHYVMLDENCRDYTTILALPNNEEIGGGEISPSAI
jgi:hypothetical protein